MSRYTFYNLRVGRDIDQVRRELRALLAAEPLVLGLCEGVGYDLPDLPGYDLVRDRSTESRANIAAYVRHGRLTNERWHDLRETWNRTEHPGVHEARSWVELRLGQRQVIVGHQPPKFTSNTEKAQEEGITFLTRQMAPWTRETWSTRSQVDQHRSLARPRVVLMDANRRPSEGGPGPARLARQIEGWVVGSGIDLAVVRGGKVVDVRYVKQPAGVLLRSDHPHALTFRFGAG